MRIVRILRHLLMPGWVPRRAFTAPVRDAIGRAVADSEHRHRAELRFVVEAGLPLPYLLKDASARERAIDLFSVLRVWDTADNGGVLIYVQWADHRVEILADRGISARVPQSTWDGICRGMEDAFRRDEFEAGAVRALHEVGTLLAVHFPAGDDNPNELPDAPLML